MLPMLLLLLPPLLPLPLPPTPLVVFGLVLVPAESPCGSLLLLLLLPFMVLGFA
jgi:hypothetical protein